MGMLSACDQLALLSPLIIHKSRTVSEFRMFQSFDYPQLFFPQLVFQAVANSGKIQEFVFRMGIETHIRSLIFASDSDTIKWHTLYTLVLIFDPSLIQTVRI